MIFLSFKTYTSGEVKNDQVLDNPTLKKISPTLKKIRFRLGQIFNMVRPLVYYYTMTHIISYHEKSML